MSVKPTRHLVDCLGKRAAEKYGSSDKDGSIREAMANLSAHSEQTSDAIYGNHEESMVFELSGQDMDKYKLCARLFNDMVGITVPRESTPSRPLVTASLTPPRPNHQTPQTAPKVKRRADELQQETEEQGSSTAYDDRVHRIPRQYYSAVAPQTGPFRVDAASSSNPVVCSKGGSKHLTELDILWDELSSKDIRTDVKSQKRLRPTTPTPEVLHPSTGQPLPSRPRAPSPGTMRDVWPHGGI